MIFKWETEEERLRRFMRIPARKKLEWLYEMNKFMQQFSSMQQGKIRQKLRRVS